MLIFIRFSASLLPWAVRRTYSPPASTIRLACATLASVSCVAAVSYTHLEGPWLTKHNGKYYMQYGAPGTEFNVYADGVYVADYPMGPYKMCIRDRSIPANKPYGEKPISNADVIAK